DLDKLDVEALARSEREAAEAMASGAFESASKTKIMTREQILEDDARQKMAAALAAAAPAAKKEPEKPAETKPAAPAEPADSERDAISAQKTHPMPRPELPAPGPSAAGQSTQKIVPRTEADDR